MSRILELLQLEPSLQSIDYVENKKQFHLFSLLTEQRHPKTWNLSFTTQADAQAGLEMLLSVDQDISRKIAELIQNRGLLEQAVEAVAEAVRTKRRIYVYGCGATGRLAKQMESTFWRPFWRKVKKLPCWEKLKAHLAEDVEESLVGEMTGADRALVSSLEGFEDLQLIGKLQLKDHGVQLGDVVFCVTEGGETSSVIGTCLAALEQYGELNEERIHQARQRLYFICNNPEEVLRPLRRSVSVLDNPAITKINLTTGPQAITGSTRLQATTSETFVVGAIIEEGIARFLRNHLTQADLDGLGFGQGVCLAERLMAFDRIKAAVDAAVPAMARFTRLETETYRRGRFSTYFAKTALITVFIDNTERSPTFRLFPLDTVSEPERKCWLQVWTEASALREAWRNFLGRPFKGLDASFYREPLEKLVQDPYLGEAALRSLTNAGNDQELLYDFSFSKFNTERRGPEPNDLGVLVLVDDEFNELEDPNSSPGRFKTLFHERGAHLTVLLVTSKDHIHAAARVARQLKGKDLVVHAVLDAGADPLTLRRQIALKMLLNAHSTAIMAALGRVLGNTMTNVSPINLKLVGRATFLIMTHVNDTLAQPEWTAAHGSTEAVTFAEANAVLFDAMDYVRARAVGQTAEVALSIIRILESFHRNASVSWREAHEILEKEGLAAYLARHNPGLTRMGARVETNEVSVTVRHVGHRHPRA